MKTKFLPFLLAIAMVVGVSSCKTKTTVKKEEGFKEIKIPCQNEGRSDKKNYRADASAKSSNMQASREKALLASKQRLASLVNSKIKSVTDRYMNETEVGDKSNFEQKFENLTREIVSQTLVDVKITCEKVMTNSKGEYQTFIATEVSKEAILNGITKRLSNKDKVQVDYDKKKFEEIYNSEMEKMENE